jgi:hypothetical protein
MNQLVKVQNPKIHHIPQSLKIFPWFSPGFPLVFLWLSLTEALLPLFQALPVDLPH